MSWNRFPCTLQRSESMLNHGRHRPTRRSSAKKRSAIMDLARGLKYDAGLEAAPKAQIEPYVREWHRLALPIITTKSYDETRADFWNAYRSAKIPLYAGIIQLAWKKATSTPCGPDIERYDSTPIRQLAALCRTLSAMSTDGAFFLPTRKSAGLIGVSQPQSGRFMQLFVTDQLIELVKSGSTTTSPRYRWVSKR